MPLFNDDPIIAPKPVMAQTLDDNPISEIANPPAFVTACVLGVAVNENFCGCAVEPKLTCVDVQLILLVNVL